MPVAGSYSIWKGEGTHLIHTTLFVLSTLRQDECGQGLMEYSLVGCLIAVAAATSIGGYGNNIAGFVNNLANKFSNVIGGGGTVGN